MEKETYIGKTVIVGYSYYDESGEFLDQKQFHGRIIDVDSLEGVRFVDDDGNERVLPPREDALSPALPGSYREYSTDDTVDNPDLISLWHVQKESGNNDNWIWEPYKAK